MVINQSRGSSLPQIMRILLSVGTGTLTVLYVAMNCILLRSALGFGGIESAQWQFGLIPSAFWGVIVAATNAASIRYSVHPRLRSFHIFTLAASMLLFLGLIICFRLRP